MRIIRRRIPRRRCVGVTPTTVTPAQGRSPPGTLNAKGNAPEPPTVRRVLPGRDEPLGRHERLEAGARLVVRRVPEELPDRRERVEVLLGRAGADVELHAPQPTDRRIPRPRRKLKSRSEYVDAPLHSR